MVRPQDQEDQVDRLLGPVDRPQGPVAPDLVVPPVALVAHPEEQWPATPKPASPSSSW